MGKLNAIEKSNYINNRYKEYICSSFHFQNQNIQELFRTELEKEQLFKGPYVDLNLPFRRGESIDSLIEEGVMSKLFKKLNNINFERPLYAHQEHAIRHINSEHGAIVTTGTGSGKTECFLFPVLNDILFDIEKGKDHKGIRAIFLYPMNALVNDQLDRVREMLNSFPEITYGFFTGDTQEKGINVRKERAQELGVQIPSNELVTREEIRRNPPHLLFTNYSMLEYLLIRPKDSPILSEESLQNWKFVILDEAHTYQGSKGIEISMLLRRLTALAKNKPRFILTSATLGEEGKSENAIITFGNRLTSYPFKVEDIIFSKRVNFDLKHQNYRVLGEDYISIKEDVENVERVKKIIFKYIYPEGSDTFSVKELLYIFLKHDQNVYKLFDLLNKECMAFTDIEKKFNGVLSRKQIISLIDLINYAEKDGLGIFDLKYHSFVRPISGAYMTLGNNPKLSLTKTNEIEGNKAFEIGNCRYCNTPYVFGRIFHNRINGLDYLFQNDEVDIYENYGENSSISLDYFLLDDSISDELDSTRVEEYEICSKCGEIHVKNNINALKCHCGEEYRGSIYKVLPKDDSFESRNNIYECPCCGGRSDSGVVKALNLGKDEGTALIAQFLYEAIDENEKKEQKKKPLSLSLKRIEDKVENDYKVKQFLTFSDSRQQASFAAVFFDSNYRRMLQKRLIWEVIKESSYSDIYFDELISRLQRLIKQNDLFSNTLTSNKNAWISCLVELLKVDGSYSAEGLGLFYFNLDLSEIENGLEEDDIREKFKEYSLNKNDFLTLMKIAFDDFKTAPAIDYSKSGLTPEEKKEYLEYRRFDNRIALKISKSKNGIKSFLPIKQTNKIVRYVMKVCKCDSIAAEEILKIVMDLGEQISEGRGSEGLFFKNDNENTYQINSSKYILKNYKSTNFYQCSKCGMITPYNIHNACTRDKCDGTLKKIDPDLVLVSNFYRNQYKNMIIEKIVIKEHTAQLKRKDAKQYQNDFKNKKINILSCSTTFEMGIDLGDLETVFMRNVPPTPANYVQRAGRAGRRKDSSAYVLTYCDFKSHDYTYFSNPQKMISGKIEPPYFEVLNRKIINRHLMAVCLGYFFKLHPEYFQSIGSLVFENGCKEFEQFLETKPKEISEFIDKKVLSEDIYKDYHNFQWLETMGGKDDKFEMFKYTFEEMDKTYRNAKQYYLDNENYNEVDYYNKQIKKLHNLNVLESLSKYCVIPKYGFPVDVVQLEVYENGIKNNKFDLNRDLKIAISEYAPESEVIVDGKKYTSRYITLSKAKSFTKYYYKECDKCKKINVSFTKHDFEKCKCGNDLNGSINFFIIPEYGFKTGITKESTRLKPKRTYAGEVSYIGGGMKDSEYLEIKDVLSVESTTNDELLVVNKSPFYMCNQCGYSVKGQNGDIIPEKRMKHNNHRGFHCENDTLEIVRLGHIFKTDVARFSTPILECGGKQEYSQALSFLYAFLEGISNALDIERNDLDGILEVNLDKNSYDILIFDNVPGGAGHVKRLMSKEAIMKCLREALKKVSQNCCDEDTSCYNCLRNYYNQTKHNYLKRGLAKEIIYKIMETIETGVNE